MRWLVAVAHPDDEVVGAATLLPRLGPDALLAYVTDGAPADGADAARHGLDVDGYRALRRRERAAALALCGIGPAQVVELGCPDQRAAHRLPELAMRMADLITRHRPEAVLTQPYEGGHPDHDATAFAVHAGAALARRGGGPAPALLEMTAYHRGAAGIVVGEFLPHAAADAACRTVVLDATLRAQRTALLDCHASQRATLAPFYAAGVERLRRAPDYDFTMPPHDGPLHYDAHAWGTTGPQFRANAAAALRQLGLDPRP